jgi:hypothetical protein
MKKLICVGCDKPAYTVEYGTDKPVCYGLWTTWGCYYTKEMIEYDRKYCFQTEGKSRDDYVALPLDSKDRKKIIKRIEELEEEHWLAISRTPHEELLKWHDEKLKTEVRILEAVH